MMRSGARFIGGDNIGAPCGCRECIEADVAREPQRRIPGETGAPIWIHGHRLRAWLDARATARAAFRSAGPKGM